MRMDCSFDTCADVWDIVCDFDEPALNINFNYENILELLLVPHLFPTIHIPNFNTKNI
jgi:hypothetical protein